MSDDHVLLTWAGTALSLAEDGSLIHTEVSRGKPPNLLFDRHGAFKTALPEPFAGRLSATPLSESGKFAVMNGEEYLCAEPNGHVSNRPHVLGWETYTLAPLREAVRDSVTPPPLPLKPRQFAIAPLIHQTAQPSSIPPECADTVARLRATNPGWSYRYWSDQDCHDFIYHYFGWEILKVYLRINPNYGAARADFFRYLCVYQQGGAYLDIKSGTRVPLNDIIAPSDEYILSQWQTGEGGKFQSFGQHDEVSHIPGGEYQQWHVIAAAGHPFLEAVINKVIQNILGYRQYFNGAGRMGVLRTTGPIAYSLAIAPIRSQHPHRLIDSEAAGLDYMIGNRAGSGTYYALLDTPVVI